MDNQEAVQSKFLKTLGQVISLNDFKGDYRAQTLEEKITSVFILSPSEKEKMGECGLLPQKVKNQITMFFQAVAFVIEQQCGNMISSMVELNDEGFGRAIIYSGRLVALSKSIRGSQQFVFQNIEKIINEGEAYVNEALALIQQYEEIAKL